MNKIALPHNNETTYTGWCDDCEVELANMRRGNGVFYREVCYHCCYLDRISQPLGEKSHE